MGKHSDYINDGYTEDGFIAAVPGLHGDLRFQYRPFLTEERAIIQDGLRTIDQKLHNRKYAEAAAKRLVSWSLTDADGKPVEIKAEQVYRIRPALFDRLIDILLGFKPSDIDPQWKEVEKTAAVDAQFQAAIDGTTIGQLTEQANEKN